MDFILEYTLLFPIEYTFQGTTCKLKKIKFARPKGKHIADGKFFTQAVALKSTEKVCEILETLQTSLDNKKNSSTITEISAFTELTNLLIKRTQLNHLENKIKLENDIFNSLKDIYFSPRGGVDSLTMDANNPVFLTIEEFKDLDFQDVSKIFKELKDFFFLTLP